MTVLRNALAAALTLALPVMTLGQAPAAAPAAPPPVVQVYGTLNVNLQYTGASDASSPPVGTGVDVPNRFAISTDSSNVGVRGTLKLNDMFSAVYQCETSANIDGEGPSGICNRNSRVGLTGNWGTVAYGNWDTPFKAGHYGTKADDPFGNTDVYGYQGIMGSPGYGVRTSSFSGAATASFDQRGGNSVIYWTPKVSGVSGRVQWGVNDTRSAVETQHVEPTLFAANVNFDLGGLSVVVASEYHEDVFGIRTVSGANAGAQTSKDLGLRGAVGYELPLGPGSFNIMGMVEQLSYKQDDATTGFKDYSRLAWMIGAKFRAGPHEVRGRFTQAMDPDITAATGTTLAAGAEDNLGAQAIAVGYAYHVAKSTQLYAFWTQIMNDDRARYTFGVAGSANVVGTNTPIGGDPSAFGVGIRQTF